MTGIGVLLGLLVLSYLGSILVAGRTIRGFGLPSGAEYVVLGVVVGPRVLGLLQGSTVESFEPVLIVGISWVAFLAGLGYRHVGHRPVRVGRALFGVLCALGIWAAGAGTSLFFIQKLALVSEKERLLLSLAGGMVTCESTRHAIRWVAERHGARGTLSDTLADMARATSIVPVVGLAVLLTLLPHEGVALPFGARLGMTFGVGAVLGAVATVLLGREFRQNESWGILIGTTLLAMGVAVRLGLSPLACCFTLGLTLSSSRHQEDIRALAQPTEKAVLLPVLLLAGTYVDFAVLWRFLPWIAVLLITRGLTEVVRGFLLSTMVKAARPAGIGVGLGLISIGPMSLSVALAYALRAPGTTSSAVLNLAVLGAICGELVGPAALRRALEAAGETDVVTSGSEAAPLESIPPPPFSSPRVEIKVEEQP